MKFVAHYQALSDSAGINHIVNTGLVYAGLVSGCIFAVTIFISGYLHHFLKIPPDSRSTFRLLVILVSLSWCFSFVFGLFGACLEAIQRFDLYNKATVTGSLLRAGGIAVLLYKGYGLIGIGVWTVVTQGLSYFLYTILFRRTVPTFQISLRFANLKTLRLMGSFGIHTFVVNISSLFLNQSPPMLIGHFFQAAFVAYYQLPMKLIQYTGEAVGRIGIITNASAAELHAKGDIQSLSELAVFTNRYSLTLFMPLAIVFWTLGDRIFNLWVPSIAKFSAPLLPILLSGYMIAVVAQFSSGMLLQGLGRHQTFARGLFAESIVVLVGIIFLLPRYGIVSGAYVVSCCHDNKPWFICTLAGEPGNATLFSLVNTLHLYATCRNRDSRRAFGHGTTL